MNLNHTDATFDVGDLRLRLRFWSEGIFDEKFYALGPGQRPNRANEEHSKVARPNLVRWDWLDSHVLGLAFLTRDMESFRPS